MNPDAGGGASRGRRLLGIYLRGVAMGIADAVPGVSGGTIALITGIYGRLVDAIAAVSERAPDLVDDLRGESDAGRVAAVRRTVVAADVPFLLVLGLGVLTGVLLLANAVDVALQARRGMTFAFFFGVILASPAVLRNEVALRRPKPLVAGVVGALLSFWVSGLPQHEAEYALPVLFLVGAVVICATVLPGISGSLLLLVIGAYDTMISAVSDVTAAVLGLTRGGQAGAVVEPLATLVVFAAGALVGLLSFARVVSLALDAYRVTTMTFLVGVMIGALRSPAREVLASVDGFTAGVVVGLLAAGAVGVLAVLGLEYVTGGVQ